LLSQKLGLALIRPNLSLYFKIKGSRASLAPIALALELKNKIKRKEESRGKRSYANQPLVGRPSKTMGDCNYTSRYATATHPAIC